MEVARRIYEEFDENAVQKWYPVPTSGSLELPFQYARCSIEKWAEIQEPWPSQQFSGSMLTWPLIPILSFGYGALPLCRGSGAIDFELPTLDFRSQAVPATSITRHIENLETTLHLTRSQLAQALRVERATLYQWLRGAQPRGKTGERLEQLRQFAAAWSFAGLGSARATWYLRVPGSELTLGSLLTQDDLDLEQLRSYIRQAQQAPKMMQLAEPKPALGFPADDRLEERRRERELFPPTFSGDE